MPKRNPSFCSENYKCSWFHPLISKSRCKWDHSEILLKMLGVPDYRLFVSKSPGKWERMARLLSWAWMMSLASLSRICISLAGCKVALGSASVVAAVPGFSSSEHKPSKGESTFQHSKQNVGDSLWLDEPQFGYQIPQSTGWQRVTHNWATEPKPFLFQDLIHDPTLHLVVMSPYFLPILNSALVSLCLS